MIRDQVIVEEEKRKAGGGDDDDLLPLGEESLVEGIAAKTTRFPAQKAAAAAGVSGRRGEMASKGAADPDRKRRHRKRRGPRRRLQDAPRCRRHHHPRRTGRHIGLGIRRDGPSGERISIKWILFAGSRVRGGSDDVTTTVKVLWPGFDGAGLDANAPAKSCVDAGGKRKR